jgi:hypothetical protein
MNREQRRAATKAMRTVVRRAKRQLTHATVELHVTRWRVLLGTLHAAYLDRDMSWLRLLCSGMADPKALVSNVLTASSYGVNTKGTRALLLRMQ